MSRMPRRRAPSVLPARLGPKAAEDEDSTSLGASRLTLRAMLPNAITAAALCAGLTGIRFAIEGEWRFAVLAVVLAGVLDGIDGRIARLLNAQSRFGAELDSLADSLSFGVAPALILYLWSLKELESFGWLAALAFAVCCALRLARFNAQIDTDEQPHKSAGFLTGVPAPVGAGLAFTPVYLWFETGIEALRNPIGLALWLGLIAVLMISNMATLSWGSLRPRRGIRLGVLAVAALSFAGLLMEPWWMLSAICIGYLALIPLGLVKYRRIRLRRAAERQSAAAEPAPATPA
jgi:CDP-diacylglycerol--serine O-phosphatidyltransferase